jgi:hypothetical protein
MTAPARWTVAIAALWVCVVPCRADDPGGEADQEQKRPRVNVSSSVGDTREFVRRAGSIQRLRVLEEALGHDGDVGERLQRPHAWRSASRDFLKFMVRHAQRSSSWELERLQTADPQEIESREDEISRTAEKIFTRAADSFIGEQLEALLERTPAVRRFRDAVDHYTSLTFDRRGARLGADPSLLSTAVAAAAAPPAEASSAHRSFRATASFRLDAHPRLVLGARFKRGSARLEVPVSGSEYRLSFERPLNRSVSGSILASRPLDDPEEWWAGMRFGIRF